MAIKILDLFAGAGGLSLGFELVRDNDGNPVYELHRAVELDKHCCETLRKRHSCEKIIEGDLTDKKIHEQVISDCKNEIDIVMGGIPCQSFSLLGPRSGSDDKKEKYRNDQRDNLYKEFHDIVSELKPKMFIIENVKGILSKKDAEGNLIINNIIKDFEEVGYNLNNDLDENKYMLLNSADYGVPQLRHRVIIIGIRNTWKNIRVPFIHPSHYNPEDHSITLQEENGLKPYVTLGEAIKDLPYLQAKITRTGINENEWENIKVINKHRNNGRDEIPMKKERFDCHYEMSSSSGKDFLNFVRGNGYKNIDHHTARGQKSTDIQLFRLMKQGEMASHFINREPDLGKELISYDMKTFTDKYRKQRYDKPCTTIFAHLSRDGNRFIHPTQSRTFTPREAARIQSFPDEVIFSGGMVEKFRQIGNAVPPLLAYTIARQMKDLFL